MRVIKTSLLGKILEPNGNERKEHSEDICDFTPIQLLFKKKFKGILFPFEAQLWPRGWVEV